MAADAPAPTGPSSLAKILIAVAAIAIVVVLLFVTGLVGGGDDDDEGGSGSAPTSAEVAQELRDGRVLAGPTQAPFAMRYTNDWALLATAQLREGKPPPLAGLRRTDRTGVLTVSVRGPIRGGISTLEKRLPDELEKRFPDFRLQTIEQIRVAGGPALYTSWVRTRTGRVQSSLVVPVSNRRSFSVDVVLNAGADEAAAETAQMLRTFDTAPTG